MWGFIPLPAAVTMELARLEAELGQVADQSARAELAALDDAAAARVLDTVHQTGDRVRNISAFIKWLARRERDEAMLMQHNVNAAGIPAAAAESAAFSSGPFSADDDLPGLPTVRSGAHRLQTLRSTTVK